MAWQLKSTFPACCTSLFQHQTLSKLVGSTIGTAWTVGLSCQLFWCVLTSFYLRLCYSRLVWWVSAETECCWICCCCHISPGVDAGEMRTWLVENCTLIYDPMSRKGCSKWALYLSIWRTFVDILWQLQLKWCPELKIVEFPWWGKLCMFVLSEG